MKHSCRLLLSLAVLVSLLGLGGAALGPAREKLSPAQAAQGFVKTLDAKGRKLVLLPFDTPQRLNWHFIPKSHRKGLQLRHMTARQRQAAHRLLAACLSQVGYDKAVVIMSLEEVLAKLEGPGRRFRRDPLRYYFTLFGTPDKEQRWGLSIEGHHLSLNFVFQGERIVAHTPAFFGANPGEVKGDYGVGPRRGTRVLKDEEALAFRLLHMLSAKQRKRAVIAAKAPRDIRGGGEPQPPQTPPEGLPAADMTPPQREVLQQLIAVYAQNMPEPVAQARLAEIEKAGLDRVYFAWAGADRPGVGHYYRIQGPTFLIELCNTQPDAAGNPANHIHSVWRDLRGDFGVPLKKGR